MAKHVSTTSPRSTASAKSTLSKPSATGEGVAALQATLSASLAALDKRTVTHTAAFHALDLIDQALGDVTATSGVLDEIITNMSDGDAKAEAIDNLFRHQHRPCDAAAGEHRGPRLDPAARERRCSMSAPNTARRAFLTGAMAAPLAAIPTFSLDPIKD